MSYIIYSFPGIDVPVFTLAVFAVGIIAYVFISDRVLSSLCLLASVVLGVTVALIASADNMLLCALVLVCLLTAVVFLGTKGRRRKR